MYNFSVDIVVEATAFSNSHLFFYKKMSSRALLSSILTYESYHIFGGLSHHTLGALGSLRDNSSIFSDVLWKHRAFVFAQYPSLSSWVSKHKSRVLKDPRTLVRRSLTLPHHILETFSFLWGNFPFSSKSNSFLTRGSLHHTLGASVPARNGFPPFSYEVNSE